jgi:hypothetical protein
LIQINAIPQQVKLDEISSRQVLKSFMSLLARDRASKRPFNLNEDQEDQTAFWGQLVYRTAVGISAVIAVLVLLNAYFNAERAFPTIPIAGLFLAGIIWGIGWLARRANSLSRFADLCICLLQIKLPHVRFGSQVDIGLTSVDVRSSLKSGHRWARLACPLSADIAQRLQCFGNCSAPIATV